MMQQEVPLTEEESLGLAATLEQIVTEKLQDKQEALNIYRTLPKVLKDRIDGFEERNPTFMTEFGKYEAMVCADAVVIAHALETPESILHFVKIPFESHVAMCPALHNSHSPHSWAFACQLAVLYKLRPELVLREHGALCSLVGCEYYGCQHGGLEAREEFSFLGTRKKAGETP